MRSRIIFSLVIIVILSSCKKDLFINEIEYEIPRKEDKIILTARLISGDTVMAHVGVSQYIMNYGGEWNFEIDSNFTVKFFKNNSFIGLMKPSSTPGYYTINEIVEPQTNYRIEVERDGFEKVIGQCWTPKKPEIENARVDTANQICILSIDILDPPSENEYYAIRTFGTDSIGRKYYHTFAIENPIPGTLITDYSLLPGSNSAYYYQFSELLFSDKYYNGKKITITFKLSLDLTGAQTTPNIEVHRITESYFEYVKSIQLAMHNDILGVIGEPVQIYTNIENGYGVIAASSPVSMKTDW